VTSNDDNDDARTEMNVIAERDDEESTGAPNPFGGGGNNDAPGFGGGGKAIEVFDDKTMYSENIFVGGGQDKEKKKNQDSF
jgi:hypothetical protein